MSGPADPIRQFLRHTVATAYRAAKPLRDAPDSFNFRCADTIRIPAKILAHISDLFDWALSMAQGKKPGATPSRSIGPPKSSVSSRP